MKTKGKGTIPQPVKGYNLRITESGYLDGLYEYAAEDGILPERWVKDFSSLFATNFSPNWELIPIVHELIWMDGEIHPIPKPEQGKRCKLLIKDLYFDCETATFHVSNSYYIARFSEDENKWINHSFPVGATGHFKWALISKPELKS